jgi:hypothetical protein
LARQFCDETIRLGSSEIPRVVEEHQLLSANRQYGERAAFAVTRVGGSRPRCATLARELNAIFN